MGRNRCDRSAGNKGEIGFSDKGNPEGGEVKRKVWGAKGRREGSERSTRENRGA